MKTLFKVIHIFFVLLNLCVCTPFATAFVQRDSIIPIIIGISLITLVVVILLAFLFIHFCIKLNKNRQQFRDDSPQLKRDEIKLIDYSTRKLSAFEAKSLPAPAAEVDEEKVDEQKNENKVSVSTLNIALGCRSSLEIPKIRRRQRRASVPATLSVLQETSPSLENSRKMSLSYNCVMEPCVSSKRTSTMITDSEAALIPESGRSSDLDENKDLKLRTKVQSQEKKYSIYNDQWVNSDEFCKLGKIAFSLLYNVDGKWLEVTIKKAHYLTGEGRRRKSRFYIKLKLCKQVLSQSMSTNSLSGPNQEMMSNKYTIRVKGSFRTCIKSDFCSPEFEETFRFTHVTPAHLKENVLQLIIKEETPKFLGKNKVIGQVNFGLKDAELTEKHESISEIVREILPVNPTKDKGYAELSLCYNASVGMLTVAIVKLIPGPEPLIDASAEFCLRSMDAIINSKKVQLDLELNSNELVVFPVENCFIHTFCLMVVIFSRIRNCSKSPYGRVIVGPIQFCDGSGLFHWEEMCLADKLIVKSHKIM